MQTNVRLIRFIDTPAVRYCLRTWTFEIPGPPAVGMIFDRLVPPRVNELRADKIAYDCVAQIYEVLLSESEANDPAKIQEILANYLGWEVTAIPK